jgi:hypothetical protein
VPNAVTPTVLGSEMWQRPMCTTEGRAGKGEKNKTRHVPKSDSGIVAAALNQTTTSDQPRSVAREWAPLIVETL